MSLARLSETSPSLTKKANSAAIIEHFNSSDSSDEGIFNREKTSDILENGTSVIDTDDQVFEGNEASEDECPSKTFAKIAWLCRKRPRGNEPLFYSCCFLLAIYLLLIITCASMSKYSLCSDGQDPSTCGVLIVDDSYLIGVIAGVMLMLYGFVYSQHWTANVFFAIVPTISLLYFLPGLLGSAAIYDHNKSQMYPFASHYVLPVCLILLCASCDLKGLVKLGWRVIVMFLAGTAGVMFGGPVAVAITGAINNGSMCGEQWRGLAYLAGSWIGGGANATAMVNIFNPTPDQVSIAVACDIIGSMIVMVIMLAMIPHQHTINRLLGANNTPVDDMMKRMKEIEAMNSRNPNELQYMLVLMFGLMCMGACNGIGTKISEGLGSIGGSAGSAISYMALDSSSFWRVVLATLVGLGSSFTDISQMEKYGASKLGGLLLKFLMATIGMSCDILQIGKNPLMFFLALVWLFIHLCFIALAAWLIKAPTFFIGTGVMANIGGAASASVVCGAYHPTLAPVGAIYGVFGYIIGTFAAWACTILMSLATPVCH